MGLPLIEVPRLISAVARTAELAELTELFTDSVDSRNPKVAVLVGVTGFGKSTLAADFCHLNRHFYEHVLWVDCRTESLIEAKFKDVITQLGIDPATITDVASTFRTEFARMGAPRSLFSTVLVEGKTSNGSFRPAVAGLRSSPRRTAPGGGTHPTNFRSPHSPLMKPLPASKHMPA